MGETTRRACLRRCCLLRLGTMKLVFYLPILTIIITCGTTNGVEQTCETRCISDYEASCPDAKVCSDNEVDCGEGPPHPSGFCEADRACVAKNCECPAKDTSGQDCPIVCQIKCSDEELQCGGTADEKGCKQPDSCVAKDKDNDGNLCPGVCPFTCKDDEIQCAVAKDTNGCQQAPMCNKKAKDTAGNDCPGICPVICDASSVQCHVKAAATGCPVADMCVAKAVDNGGELCPGTCPVECAESDILCPGAMTTNGCKTADVCRPKAKDTNGDYCPSDSASHNCATACSEKEALCPGEMNALGCKGSDECKAKTVDANGEFCPDTSVCHTPCNLHEISCRLQGVWHTDVSGQNSPFASTVFALHSSEPLHPSAFISPGHKASFSEHAVAQLWEAESDGQ